jgi:mRNA-degrading endonuclease toxin of MazEF toxin-antitoxin module
MPPLPNRGEVWLADLNPTRGHEQEGARPVLIISTDPFNQGPAGLVFVLPLTRTDRRVPINEGAPGGGATPTHVPASLSRGHGGHSPTATGTWPSTSHPRRGRCLLTS